MQQGLHDLLGYAVDDREMTLAQFVHAFADTTGDGSVTLEDFQRFCDEIDDIYQRDKWRLEFPKMETRATAETAKAP